MRRPARLGQPFVQQALTRRKSLLPYRPAQMEADLLEDEATERMVLLVRTPVPPPGSGGVDVIYVAHVGHNAQAGRSVISVR